MFNKDIFKEEEFYYYDEKKEKKSKCVSTSLSLKDYDTLRQIATKIQAHSVSGMINVVFSNLIKNIVENGFEFRPDFSVFHINPGEKRKPLRLHINEEEFNNLNKICKINGRSKSIIAQFAAFSCIKERSGILHLDYKVSILDFDFDLGFKKNK